MIDFDKLLLISAVVALIFYKLGRWTAFRSRARGLRLAMPENKTIQSGTIQPSGPTSAAVDEALSEKIDSVLDKYTNSIQHREKFRRSNVSG